ncbi:hypothetical protein RvY_06932-2 [Ramazzottius varieornatus]|uniref:Uncharacterized protein n=1 Tax=Ramazzottius varieornatus TaxID=947166 RepID=A0A1D1V6L0_RAMVA|nr:hypothetical protein RvY_06932-2 [Ramazzottius varieornatus]
MYSVQAKLSPLIFQTCRTIHDESFRPNFSATGESPVNKLLESTSNEFFESTAGCREEIFRVRVVIRPSINFFFLEFKSTKVKRDSFHANSSASDSRSHALSFCISEVFSLSKTKFFEAQVCFGTVRKTTGKQGSLHDCSRRAVSFCDRYFDYGSSI